MKLLTVADARMMKFLDNSWSQEQYKEYLEMDGAWGVIEGLSYILGLRVDDSLFVEKFRIKTKKEIEDIFARAKTTFKEIRVQSSYEVKGLRSGNWCILCPDQNLITLLYDSDFELGFLGNQASPTLEMTWTSH